MQRVSRLCGETVLGCDLERALPRLREEYDVEELTGGADELRAVVTDPDDPLPVIAIIQNDPIGSPDLNHAVVVVEIRQERNESGLCEVVSFMDPLTGRIEEDSTGFFWQCWSADYERAFVIRP